MPTITALTLIQKAQTILQDVSAVRWSNTELLGWLNDGQREIVALRSDANSKIVNLTCVAGTKQTLPTADGLRLLDVIRNMGTSGTDPGDAIRRVPVQILDAHMPNWHYTTPSNSIKHFVHDPRFPTTFYVYPPANAGTKLEIAYAATPTDVAAVGNVINLDDIYAGPLLDYMLYRAYSKDTEFPGNANRAAAARAAFENTLSLKAASDAANAPQVNETT